MGFLEDLDRYLTTDHETDKWISFYEIVAGAHSDEFYDNNDDWIFKFHCYNIFSCWDFNACN